MEQNDNLEKELKETVDQMTPKGSLFESIHYFNDEQLNSFYENIRVSFPPLIWCRSYSSGTYWGLRFVFLFEFFAAVLQAPTQ